MGHVRITHNLTLDRPFTSLYDLTMVIIGELQRKVLYIYYMCLHICLLSITPLHMFDRTLNMYKFLQYTEMYIFSIELYMLCMGGIY